MTSIYKGNGRSVCQPVRKRANCPVSSSGRATCYVNARVRYAFLYCDLQRDGVTRPSARNVWATAPVDVPLPPPSEVVYTM
jgi:hypothetical protein